MINFNTLKNKIFGLLFLMFTLNACAQTDTLLLWPSGAPGAKGSKDIDKPAVIPYFAAPDKYNGTSIILFPGGAYYAVAFGEGTPAATWLNSLGINVFIVRYRCTPYHHPIEINDGERAIRFVKSKAVEWKIDTTRLGIMGFSAGGHMASTVLTHPLSGKPDTTDLIERFNTKLSFAMLIYPVITMSQEPYVHQVCRYNILGSTPTPADKNYPTYIGNIEYLSAERNITKNTPPNFLTHADNDAQVPVENSIMFRDSCKAKGVSSTLRILHITGPNNHGFSTGGSDPSASIWTSYAEQWLDSMGLLQKTVTPVNSSVNTNQTLSVSMLSEDLINVNYDGSHFNHLNIYNSRGQIIKQISLQQAKKIYEINISSYSAGMYIIRTDEANSEIKPVKFVVK